MIKVASVSSFLALGAVLLLPACDSGGDGTESSGSTGGTTTGVVDPPGSSTSGVDPSATSSTTTVDPPATSTSTTEDGSSSGGSSSTGEPGDCVDEDIGSAVGQEVVTGQNEGQGDDFSLRYCDGGVGSTTGPGPGPGPDDTGDPTDPTGMTSGGTSFGTTGGPGDSGDDFVVSWTPPATGPFTIDTFGSGIDTVLTVVEPVCGAARGECNDDCNGLESGVVFEATEGETVFIVIEGYGGRQGEFQLNITEGGDLECGGVGSTGELPDTDGEMTTVGTSP